MESVIFRSRRYHSLDRAFAREKFRRWLLVCRRDQRRCFYCKKMLYDQEINLDHVIPFCLVRDDAISNMVVCCENCNNRKDCKGDLIEVMMGWREQMLNNGLRFYHETEGKILLPILPNLEEIGRGIIYDTPARSCTHCGKKLYLRQTEDGLFYWICRRHYSEDCTLILIAGELLISLRLFTQSINTGDTSYIEHHQSLSA